MEEVKKEEEPKPEVVIEEKQPEPVVEEELQAPEEVTIAIVGESVIKYNHYKKKFKHRNGAISFEDIEEQYAFSVGYVGNYDLKLRKEKERDVYLKSENKVF